MSRKRRNRLLVPEAREALDRLIQITSVPVNSPSAPLTGQHNRTMRSGATNEPVVASVAQSLGIAYQSSGDNGDMTTRDAGRIGGEIGGQMVQKLVQIAKEQLVLEEKDKF